jgi:hypothetical protein
MSAHWQRPDNDSIATRVRSLAQQAAVPGGLVKALARYAAMIGIADLRDLTEQQRMATLLSDFLFLS